MFKFYITALLSISCPILTHAADLSENKTLTTAIADIQSSNPPSTLVVIEGKEDWKDSVILIDALKDNKTVTDLTIHNCMIPNADSFIQMLSANSTLQHLDLRYNKFKGDYSLQDLPFNTTLISLTLMGNHFSSFKSLNAITNITSGLKTFTFGPHFTGSLAFIPIEAVTFSGKRLEANPTLGELKLIAYPVNTSLLSRLLKNQTLKSLCLDSASITDDIIDRISIVLNRNTNITSLSLPKNQVRVAKHFSGMQNLTSLDLSGNGSVDLEQLNNMPNLTALNLSGNKLIDSRPLATMTTLISLNLNGSTIQDIAPLLTLLNANSPLKELGIENLNLSQTDSDLLTVALKDKPTLKFLTSPKQAS